MTDDQAGPSGSGRCLLPRTVSSDGTAQAEDAALYEVADSGRIRPRRIDKTPEINTPKRKRSSANTAFGGHPKRGHTTDPSNENTCNMLYDSGSDEGDEGSDGNDDDLDVINFVGLRGYTRQIRNRIVMTDPEDGCIQRNDANAEDSHDVRMNERMVNVQLKRERMNEETIHKNVDVVIKSDENTRGRDVNHERESAKSSERSDMYERCEKSEQRRARVSPIFSWSDDFSTFNAQKETYTREPGPAFSSHDPAEYFYQVWDREFMEMVVRETNLYAWNFISQSFDPNVNVDLPKYLESWTEITVEELYRYFALLILMSICHRSNIREYWEMGVMYMPQFREIMGRNRFQMISKFLHFTSNENLATSGHLRKIAKIEPVVAHCNRKFKDLYTPTQHLSLDESLLLWKGSLNWRQSIKTKAARFGIKSFELCEAETGYLLQYRLYTGKSANQYPDPILGFHEHTAKVVLDLIDGYLDVGHVLVMDNWYNQLLMTRYLKSRFTDVLGTLNRRRNGVPPAVKDLMPNVPRGTTVSSHSGDITLVAWQDVKLVTIMSTYHSSEMVLARRARQAILKPKAVIEYNKYMGGVDLKDQKLSMFLIERKRNQKWYMKVFKRLFNTSLLNLYIMYTKNPMYHVYSHREFRKRVVYGLLSRYPAVPGPYRSPSTSQCLQRLQPGQHFPVHTELASRSYKAKHKQLRCVRCAAQHRRVCVTLMCKECKIALCVGKCWEEYHTLVKL